MTSTLRAFAFIAIVCGFGGALAQPASSSSGPTSRPAPATVEARSASAPTAVSSAEVAVLQAQLAVMQVFTDRILSTVYWAIGGVFAIAALLIGYNVFSSYRMQNREIANLTADLQHGQELALALMNDQMDKLTKKYEAGITAAAEKAAAVGLADVKKRLDTQRSMLDGQQLSLARHVMKSEARYWELSKVGGNEIRSLLGLLEHDLKTSDDLEMGDVLMRIQELLPELAEIYPDDANMLHELLGKLPAKLNPQIAAVRKELSKVKLG